MPWMVTHNIPKSSEDGAPFMVICYALQCASFTSSRYLRCIYLSVMINFIEIVVQFSKVINQTIVSTSVAMKRAVIMLIKLQKNFRYVTHFQGENLEFWNSYLLLTCCFPPLKVAFSICDQLKHQKSVGYIWFYALFSYQRLFILKFSDLWL